MARRASRRAVSKNSEASERSRVEADNSPAVAITPNTTGRFLVLFREGASASSIRTLSKSAGLSIASTADFKTEAFSADKLGGADGVLFPDLGVAVVDSPPEQMSAAAVAASSDILAVEPERICYALGDLQISPSMPVRTFAGGVSADYLMGYRDAVNHLCDKLLGISPELGAEGLAPLAAETENTWGLQVTKVPGSQFSGRGIRVAVLDTGFDLTHPDFAGRSVTSRSFIAGEQVQDGHGHGTHCIGTACGPQRPGVLPRYGVAYEADIFAGKVLSNQGSGADGGILAGIQWAITNRCAIVSMSLGSAVQEGESFSPIYETAATRALAAGTLIIAAAGNDSRRPQSIIPVSRPANCPSIMAVAALDRNIQMAFFSNGGLNPQGGQVDLAGPGVDVRSSWPQPTRYNTISGTSMATPHVAGIAALWAQSNAANRGRTLMSVLTQSARRLTLSGRDVGAGLVQAP
jgi:subtilisin